MLHSQRLKLLIKELQLSYVDIALRVDGDSMTGVGIYNGGIVYVRKQPTVSNGEIAVVIIDDGHPDSLEGTVKRFYRFNKTVL